MADINLKGRDFLTLKDFSPEEILYMIDMAAKLKAQKKAQRKAPRIPQESLPACLMA